MELTSNFIKGKKRVWEEETFPGEFSPLPLKGKVYDDKAFPIHLEANKQYLWCTCGISKSQPICDGSHARLDETSRIKKRPCFRPHAFTVPKSGTYHLCNCKQTNNRPFCDGTHREQFVQESPKNRS